MTGVRLAKPEAGFRSEFQGQVDDRIRYVVDVDEGFVNATELDGYGQDVFAAMDPVTARKLASLLVEAAQVAERHPRWRDG